MEENYTTDVKDFIKSKVIGMNLKDADFLAKSAGCSIRPVQVNGQFTIGTRDYNENRLNVVMEDDIIVASRGWN